ASMDPSDQKVQKMLGDTSQDRSRLVDSYLSKSKASMSTVTDKTPDAVREKSYTDAYQYASKAMDIDPRSTAAQAQVSAVKAQIAKIVANDTTSVQKLVAVSKFADARTQLGAMNDLNRRTSNGFDADVRA